MHFYQILMRPNKTSLNPSQSEILAYNGFVKAAGLFFLKNHVHSRQKDKLEMEQKIELYIFDNI